MINTLIFDYNQVLINDKQTHIKAYLKTFQKYGLDLSKEEIDSLMHKTHKEKLVILNHTYNLTLDEKFTKDKEDLYIKLAKEKDLFFPGTIEAIEKLSEKYTLGVVSGTCKKQLYSVIPKKLEEKFEAIVNIEEYIEPKPSPRGLEVCMEKLRKKPSECAYVGDSAPDMTAAIAAGCKPIGIPTGNFTKEQLKEAGARIVINSIKELTELKL